MHGLYMFVWCISAFNVYSYACIMYSIGFSDPYVCVALMPERRFKTKPVKTDYKGKDLNPTYYKEFNMYVNLYVGMSSL